MHFILALLIITSGFSQNEARNWYFGTGTGLDFSTQPPTVLQNGAISTTAGCSAISNTAGALQFYTDGVTVWTQNHSVMANGTGLAGTSGAQNCVIVKRPGSANLYYIFTVEGGGGSAGFCYSVVDMSLSSGQGSVTVKNATLFPFSCEEKISATRHCNQTDAWVIARPVSSNSFVAVPVGTAGVGAMVTSTYNIYSGSSFTTNHTGASPRGSLKFSPNGRRLAEVFTLSSSTPSAAAQGVMKVIFETYEFDNSTGLVSNYQWISGFTCPLSNCWAYGSEYSPDGTKFYYTYHGILMQVNYCVYPSLVHGSLTQFGDPLSMSHWRATLQLGPDGKIYVANPGNTSLGVIHYPNNPAPSSCSYQPVGISLGSVTCQYGLPNFYTSYFEKTSTSITVAPVPGFNCRSFQFFSPPSCITFQNASTPISGYVVNSYQWNFGDPGSGAANTSSLSAPVHDFSASGTFTITLLKNYLCGRTDTATYVLVVPANSHSATVITPSLSCGLSSATVVTSGSQGGLSYSWMPGGGSGPVATGLAPGIYTVFVADNGTGCTITRTVNTSAVTISSSLNVLPVCAGYTSGSATVAVSGGSGSYSYSWTGSSANSSTVSGLSLGIHTVTVFDNFNNCATSHTFQVSQAPALQAVVVPSQSGPICTGAAAWLTGTVSGGTPPYAPFWVNGPPGNTVTVPSATPGIQQHTLTVTDALNCSVTTTFNITVLQTPTVGVTNATTCPGVPVTLSAWGATVINWLPGLMTGNFITVNPSSTTVYTVVGSNGPCSAATTSTVHVLQVAPPWAVNATSPVCAGKLLSLSAQGCISYTWTGPGGFTSTQQSPVVQNVQAGAAGTYTVKGTSPNGCVSGGTTVQVQVLPAPPVIAGANSPLCEGQTLSLTATGGASYLWQGPGGFSSVTQAPVLALTSVTHSGVYTVTATNSFSCSADAFVTVNVMPAPNALITGNSEVCYGQQLVLVASGGVAYSWSNGWNAPTVSVQPWSPTVYSVTVTGQNGCTAAAYHNVTVNECTGVPFEQSGIFRFYPNPHSSSFEVESPVTIEIRLLDVNLRVLGDWRFLPGVNTIDTQDLPAGIYLMTVRAGGGQQAYKVVRVQ